MWLFPSFFDHYQNKKCHWSGAASWQEGVSMPSGHFPSDLKKLRWTNQWPKLLNNLTGKVTENSCVNF